MIHYMLLLVNVFTGLLSHFLYFLFVVPPVRLLPFTYPHLRFPFSFFLSVSRFLPGRGPPLENVTATILSYAVSNLHEGTGKLRKTCADSISVCPQSTVSGKMTSRSAFRSAGRGLTVTHQSTDPARSCLTCVNTWCRTPTTHRTLSVISFFINKYILTYFWGVVVLL